MADGSERPAPCGIDTVEIARIERLLHETPAEDLRKVFSATELAESGNGPGRAASLAARFAAKEACLKLFPRETALGLVGPADFSVARNGYGAPSVTFSPAATELADRYRIKSIALSLTHDRTSASAVALCQPARTAVPLSGRLIYHLLPIRRGVILENLRRVFAATVPEAEIERLAQAHYAHLWRLFVEFLWFPWVSAARKHALVRVENVDSLLTAHGRGNGVLVL